MENVVLNIFANSKNAVQNIGRVSQVLQNTKVQVKSLTQSMSVAMRSPFVTGALSIPSLAPNACRDSYCEECLYGGRRV